MKCKSCGANYRTRELKCPYCGTENMLGHIWMAEVSEAEQKYEEERALAKKGLPLYVMNRVINRILLVLVLLLVLSFVVYVLVCGRYELGSLIRSRVNADETKAQLETYYKSGEWDKLYEYMSENDLFGSDEDYYNYSQAALLGNEYEYFLEDKYAFYQMSDEEKAADDYRLKSCLRAGNEVLNLDLGLFGDRNREIAQSEQYQEWCEDIRSYWKSVLGMTDEEIEYIASADYLSYDELGPLAETIKERQGWKEVPADGNAQ